MPFPTTWPRARLALARVMVPLLPLVGPLTSQAYAQDRAPTLELAGGWVGFPDDGATVTEWMVGGSARWLLSPRVGIGPEIVHIGGARHSHLMVTGNLTYEVLAASGALPRPVTAFVVAGVGLFQTRQDFVAGRFTSTEGAFTAGGGLRLAAGERVTYGVDARIGWELHLRLNAFIGLRLGR